MDGLNKVREAVNKILFEQKNMALQQEGWAHLYGVSQQAAMLSHHRNLDVETCAAAGMLHDIYTFRTGGEVDHARLGAAEAVEILHTTGQFDANSISTIERMILRHSDKQAKDGPYEECLKDADVFAHWLFDSKKKFDAAKKQRLEYILQEFGLNGTVEEE